MKRLLLVEDDFDVAEMLVMYFESHNYEVIHADTGLMGVERARQRFPNLILLDVMLPDMDGYDVCRKLRQTAITKYIPILFLTQRDERASKVRGLELGADDYITKPFDVDELRLRVQRTIQRATRENLHEARTGLPTGPLVHDEITARQKHIPLVYRIDAFDVYRDVYGFVAANDVLSYAGHVIQQTLSTSGTDDDFVGIVKNEFVVLTGSDNPQALDKAIRSRFNEEVRAFYSFMDVDQGGVSVGDELAPLMMMVSEERLPSLIGE